jgi:hypothetical protein
MDVVTAGNFRDKAQMKTVEMAQRFAAALHLFAG